MTVWLHPIPVVCAGQVTFPSGQALAGFGELMVGAPNVWTVPMPARSAGWL
jgi:hypothetical protein